MDSSEHASTSAYMRALRKQKCMISLRHRVASIHETGRDGKGSRQYGTVNARDFFACCEH